MPTLSAQTLSTLAVAGTAVAVVSLAGVAALAGTLAKVRRSYARLLAGGSRREDIVAAVDRHLAAVDRLARTTDGLIREVAELRQRSSTLVRTVGLARYDGFDDVGGRRGRAERDQQPLRDALVRQAGRGRALRAQPVRRGAGRDRPGHGPRPARPQHRELTRAQPWIRVPFTPLAPVIAWRAPDLASRPGGPVP